MKKIITYAALLLAIAFVTPGCDKDNDAEVKPLHLHLDIQTSFSNDQVTLQVDDSIVYNAAVTTSNVITLAGKTGPLEMKAGAHTIKVIVNNTITQTAAITLTADLYTGINYNRNTNEITFTYRNSPFPYR